MYNQIHYLSGNIQYIIFREMCLCFQENDPDKKWNILYSRIKWTRLEKKSSAKTAAEITRDKNFNAPLFPKQHLGKISEI